MLLGFAAVTLALLVTACGGGGDEGEAADGVITVNWGSEPPSLDPGLASDTTSANVITNLMDPLLKLEGENLEPTPNLAESWEVNGKHGDVQAAAGRQVDERRPGHRAGLRVLVEAHDLSRPGGGLRVPVLRDRRSVGLQLVQEQLRGDGRQGRHHGSRRHDASRRVDEPAAVVHPAGRPPLVPRRPPADGRAVRREVDRGREHRHERAVPARHVAAQLAHRPREVARVAQRRRDRARARQRAHDLGRHDGRAGLRGR